MEKRMKRTPFVKNLKNLETKYLDTESAMSDIIAAFTVSDVPIGLVMIGIGFHTEAGEIGSVLTDPANRAAFAATLASTMFLVPFVAFTVVTLTPGLSAEAVLGIVTVSLLPGGPLANIAAIVTGANKALNVLLTSTEMVLSSLLVPLGLLFVLPRVVDASQIIQVPFAEQAHGILIVVAPLLGGIGMSHAVGSPAGAVGVRRSVFRLLVLCAVVVVVAAKLTGQAEASIFFQAIPLLRATSQPPLATVAAAVAFGCITVAWSLALGLLFMPSQSRANRISICLEVGVRDLTFGLVIAVAGLPSLAMHERANVVVAVLIAWATCNLGVVVVALVTCICSGSNALLPVSVAPSGGARGLHGATSSGASGVSQWSGSARWMLCKPCRGHAGRGVYLT